MKNLLNLGVSDPLTLGMAHPIADRLETLGRARPTTLRSRVLALSAMGVLAIASAPLSIAADTPEDEKTESVFRYISSATDKDLESYEVVTENGVKKAYRILENGEREPATLEKNIDGTYRLTYADGKTADLPNLDFSELEKLKALKGLAGLEALDGLDGLNALSELKALDLADGQFRVFKRGSDIEWTEEFQANFAKKFDEISKSIEKFKYHNIIKNNAGKFDFEELDAVVDVSVFYDEHGNSLASAKRQLERTKKQLESLAENEDVAFDLENALRDLENARRSLEAAENRLAGDSK